jgi:hypothetical protein
MRGVACCWFTGEQIGSGREVDSALRCRGMINPMMLSVILAAAVSVPVHSQIVVHRANTEKLVSVWDGVDGKEIPIGAVVNGGFSLDIATSLSPSSSRGVQGSVGGAGITLQPHRYGGVGVFGYDLTNAYVSAMVPFGEFDVAKTAWLTGTNWNGGQGFGGWLGANTPSSEKPGEIFVAGAAVGLEVNAGNRWSDFGPQDDIGTKSRYTVGLQVVPDPVPAADVETTNTYPGTFGVVLARAQHGQRWWTGLLTSHDAIVPGGHARISRGSLSVAEAPADIERADGFWTNGFVLENAKFNGAAVVLGDNQRVCFNSSDACLYHANGKIHYDVKGQHIFSVADSTGDVVFRGRVIEHGTP